MNYDTPPNQTAVLSETLGNKGATIFDIYISKGQLQVFEKFSPGL